MKSSKTVLAVLAILLCSSLSCTFLKDKFQNLGVADQGSIKVPDLPPFDPNAPLPSGGAIALRQLAELEPSVAPLIDSVEAAERSAMKKVVAKARLGSGDNTDRSAASAPLSSTARPPTSGNRFASVIMFQGGESDEGNRRTDAAATLGVVISFLGDIYGKLPLEKMEYGFKPDIPRETVDGVTSDTKLEVSRGKDGATVTLLGIKSEGIKNGMQFKTEMAGKIDGQRCPNAEGQVSFTVKLRLNVEADGSVYSQDLTAFVRASVNDNAGRASQTIDVIQGTRHVKSGRELYIETGVTYSREGTANTNSASNYREIRTSSQVKARDRKISDDGLIAAYNFGEGSLAAAEATWLGGGCTVIVANSPGTVATSSTTAIPVVVRHRFEGAEIPSKLDVVLKGETSVDPTSIAKTAGTLTYVAPGETGKSSTISLTATSRRGRATLDLVANTGGASYRIVGGLDDWQTDNEVCDIMQPFVLTDGQITMKLSGGLSGTYEYSGSFNAHGTGTYTISLPDGVGKPGTMTGSGEGSAEGHSNSGTEKYTLTPIKPC